ncbi:MAG: histidine phosphatase family protein [Woeseiaceae bacterium]
MNLPEYEFVFLRHGETAYNREGRFQGQIDVPLNSVGVAQAEYAANALAHFNISRIVSSPARRVLQTVQPLTQTDAVTLHTEDHLMELSVGSFEGRLIAEVRREHGLSDRESWLPILPPDAECWQEFESRVLSAVARWTEQHASETILIASHGLVFHVLVDVLTGEKTYSRNAEPHLFKPDGDGWTVSPVSV